MDNYGLVVFLLVPLFEKGQILFDADSLMFRVPFRSVSTGFNDINNKDASKVAIFAVPHRIIPRKTHRILPRWQILLHNPSLVVRSSAGTTPENIGCL